MAFTFFPSTRSALAEIRNLYDFAWPTAAGMWNLRWQVKGFVDAAGDVDDETLRARFTSGSNINRPNLRTACLKNSWQSQLDQFAKILLVDFIAIYESWSKSVVETLLSPSRTAEDLSLGLQFPRAFQRSGRNRDVHLALATLNTTGSAALTACLYPTLKSNSKYQGPNLENLLICFRAFKEMRNAIVHNGGMGDGRVANTFAALAAIPDLTLRTIFWGGGKPHLEQELCSANTNPLGILLSGFG